MRHHYAVSLTEALHHIPLPNPSLAGMSSADAEANSLNTALSNAMHNAAGSAQIASSAPTSSRKRRHWWTADCTAARDRMRLFFHIWKSCQRPSEGVVYECYREARRAYRRICRKSFNTQQKQRLQLIDRLYATDRPGKFWNLVKKFKGLNVPPSQAIGLDKLHEFYRTKLDPPAVQSNESITNMENWVTHKNLNLTDNVYTNITVSEARVRRLMRHLRHGCAPRIDGLSAEHLCHAADTDLPLYISVLLTLCIRYGCFPDSFGIGRLIPVLKKPHLDPSLPANYRPITVSVVLSKLLELYILEECADFSVHPCQFGFTSHRGTTTAISLAHDVAAYCVAKGSCVHFCSLDAEGAFDTIPHGALFFQAAKALPDHCWRMLYKWYTSMSVTVCWSKHQSPLIRVKRGTRQGGLSSPFLFNVFYMSLIEQLDDMNCGVSIGNHRYNVFSYADDVLLASTTITGLQRLIDTAVAAVDDLGLKFNPAKTATMTYGRCSLRCKPSWSIGQSTLTHEETITYLGAVLHTTGTVHVERRTSSAQKAFYGLQSAGLHFQGVDPHVSAKLYSVGVKSVMMYGAEAIALSQSNIKALATLQGKMVKSFL
jgi:hypothetical protein